VESVDVKSGDLGPLGIEVRGGDMTALWPPSTLQNLKNRNGERLKIRRGERF